VLSPPYAFGLLLLARLFVSRRVTVERHGEIPVP
jgi:hypothetical protein